MAKCATCVSHEKDKRMENALFSPDYYYAFFMRLSNSWKMYTCGTFGHVVLPNY